MKDDVANRGGLEGIVAGQTALCTVGKEGAGSPIAAFPSKILPPMQPLKSGVLLLYGTLPKHRNSTISKSVLKSLEACLLPSQLLSNNFPSRLILWMCFGRLLRDGVFGA